MPLYVAIVTCACVVLQQSLGYLLLPLAALALGVPTLVNGRRTLQLLGGCATLALAIWVLVASVVCGLSAESLCASLLPLVCFMSCALLGPLDAKQKVDTAVALCFCSACIAVIGVAFFSLGVEMSWAVGKHVEYGFGNAEIAAGWFASISLLCQALGNRNRFLVVPLALNVVGLMLTCSVVVVALFCLVEFVYVLRGWKDSLVAKHVVIVLVGAFCAAGVYALDGTAGVALVVLVALFCFVWFADSSLSRLCEHRWVLWLCIGVGVLGVAIAVSLSQRLAVDASASVVLFAIEVQDAIACVLEHPLWGVGAGQWMHLGTQYQSYVYALGAVPCSFVHVAVESGVLAALLVLFAVGAAVYCSHSIGLGGALAASVAALVAVGTHALVSPAYCLLLVIVGNAGYGAGTEGESVSIMDPAAPMNWFFRVFTSLLALLASAAMMQTMFIGARMANAASDARAVCEDYLSEPYWVQNSPSVRTLFDRWLIAEIGEEPYTSREIAQRTEDLRGQLTQPNVYDDVAHAYSLAALDDVEGGLQVLVDSAKRNRCVIPLRASLRNYLDVTGWEGELAEEATLLADEFDER